MNGQALLWWIGRLAKRLGVWGLLGLLLLVISAFVYWIKVPEVLQKIAAAEQAQANLNQENKAKIQKQAQDPAKQDAQAAARFYERFNTLAAVPGLLKGLHKQAKRNQLTLEVGDYRYQKTNATREENGQLLTQYKMVFPVEGRYTNIRQFVEAVLTENPEVALLDLQIVREERHSNVVAARLVFAVYVKDTNAQN